MLQIARSTYYAAKSRPPSARSVADEALKPEIERVHRAASHGVYGAEKVWWQLGQRGLRRRPGPGGAADPRDGAHRCSTRHTTFTTTPNDAAQRPEDLVKRNFSASVPNRLWVADLTYVWTWSGFAYTAFVTDVFSRYIVGWRVGTTLAARLALDALEMGIWTRRGQHLGELVHHSDRGVQYLAIVYSTRLEEAGVAPSVGSKGDSFDNALAESINASYKAECTERLGLGGRRRGTRDRHGRVGRVPQQGLPPARPRQADAGGVRGRLLGANGARRLISPGAQVHPTRSEAYSATQRAPPSHAGPFTTSQRAWRRAYCT